MALFNNTSFRLLEQGLDGVWLKQKIISQNIANAETTRTVDGTPYRRKLVIFEEKKSFKKVFDEKITKYEGVGVTKVIEDDAPFVPVYDPNHPDADENGYVNMPNVDRTKETLDLMVATRSYEANVTAINAVKAMASRALQIGK